ncbi:hypothetical protein PR202_ga16787 [Eleusine coracana subsp. coracana]|uniref:UBC core domain-containing protein n=1 Tax=Eleusine coracana subsp. coracana TaxID=191504 RepID=A0AAV5CP67_ELECO|nr:hypothetical protein PR202_ga16787 [Eleusine coracana subsp. coracana]
MRRSPMVIRRKSQDLHLVLALSIRPVSKRQQHMGIVIVPTMGNEHKRFGCTSGSCLSLRKMINLFKIKGQKKEDAASAAGKTPVKKQSAGELRLHKDISELNLPKTTSISFPNGKDDLMNFEIIIRPDEGYYMGGTFVFTFQVSLSYPHEPPKVKCKTKVYHPNIDLEGNVCLNILREDWKPVLNINTVIHGLNLLFTLLVDADKGTTEKALAVLDSLRYAHGGRSRGGAHKRADRAGAREKVGHVEMATEFAVSALWRLCKGDDVSSSGGGEGGAAAAVRPRRRRCRWARSRSCCSSSRSGAWASLRTRTVSCSACSMGPEAASSAS